MQRKTTSHTHVGCPHDRSHNHGAGRTPGQGAAAAYPRTSSMLDDFMNWTTSRNGLDRARAGDCVCADRSLGVHLLNQPTGARALARRHRALGLGEARARVVLVRGVLRTRCAVWACGRGPGCSLLLTCRGRA